MKGDIPSDITKIKRYFSCLPDRFSGGFRACTVLAILHVF
jgi:hypothetical protein